MLSIFAFAAAAVPAAIILASPASAEPDRNGSFEHDGYTYVYKVRDQGEAQLIQGRRYPDGAAFSLRVRNGMVSGVSNGASVSFRVADAAGSAKGAKEAELSMR